MKFPIELINRPVLELPVLVKPSAAQVARVGAGAQTVEHWANWNEITGSQVAQIARSGC